MSEVNQVPNPDAIKLGADHMYEKTFYEDQWVGIHEWHKTKNGKWCVGWIPFSSSPIATGDTWDVQSLDPLTLSPSLLCQACGSHGFIRNGAWVEA